jgi:hypothetical protein
MPAAATIRRQGTDGEGVGPRTAVLHGLFCVLLPHCSPNLAKAAFALRSSKPNFPALLSIPYSGFLI